MCSSTISEVFCQFVFFALERLEQNSGLTFFCSEGMTDALLFCYEKKERIE